MKQCHLPNLGILFLKETIFRHGYNHFKYQHEILISHIVLSYMCSCFSRMIKKFTVVKKSFWGKPVKVHHLKNKIKNRAAN